MSKRNYTIHAAGKTIDEVNADLNSKLESANDKLEKCDLESLTDPAKTTYIVERGTTEIKSQVSFVEAADKMAESFQNPDDFRIEQLYKVTPTQFEALSEERKATAGENINRRYAVRDITFKF